MKIGIAGAGTMSASMALIFLEQGYDTILHVRSERSMDRARGIIGVSLTAEGRHLPNGQAHAGGGGHAPETAVLYH